MDANIVISERLDNIIKSEFRTQTEFAERLGISRGQISYYKHHPSSLRIVNAIKELGYSSDWYLHGRGEMKTDVPLPNIANNLIPVELPSEVVSIPIYDISVYANTGGGITDINQVPYSIMNMTSNYEGCKGFKVIGESMIEEGIMENDIVIVNEKIKPKNYSLVVLNLNGLLMIKRVVIIENGKWELHSSKTGVLPILEYDQDTMTYLGKVIEIKRFIRD